MGGTDWSRVVQAGRRLPGVDEGVWSQCPVLRVKGRRFVILRGEATLLCPVNAAGRQALGGQELRGVVSGPEEGMGASLIVDLDQVEPEVLRRVVEAAWRAAAPKPLVDQFDRGRSGPARRAT